MPRRKLASSSSRSRPPQGGLWEIQVLGGLRVRNGDLVVTRFATRAVVELLASLLLHAPRSQSREKLIQDLWPDVELRVGANRLRNALSQLKAVFGGSAGGEAGVVVADRRAVRLNLDSVVCDVVEFEEHARHGRQAAARECYRGELLPGFNAEWLHDERLRLSGLYDRLAESGLPDRLDLPPHESPGRARVRNQILATDGTRHRLPSYLTGFFGREKEVQELGDALSAHRLVTVTGMGGCGKTRLCVETARRQARFDLTCLVRLEQCADPALLADHVREALGLQAGAPSAVRQIAASMEGKQILLVLDGLERLVGDVVGKTIEELQSRLPALHLLVSSQIALRLPGEREYRLLPLPLAPADVSPDDAVANPGIALFLHRAREVRADFNIHARNVAHVAAVCRAAEGLPLIIELAAARLRSLPARKIGDAMAGDWSGIERTNANGRHDSLVTAIGWSLGLLDAEQRAFLASISVFRGGCTEIDAAAVTGREQAECRDQLAALAAVSMVQAHVGEDGHQRFHLPRHIADVIRTGLSDAEARRLRAQHRLCFLARASSVAEQYRLINEADASNLIEALSTAVEDGESKIAVQLALVMGSYWNACGLSEEAAGLLRRIAAQAGAAEQDSAARVIALAARLFVQGGHVDEARGLADAALRCAVDTASRADALLAKVGVQWRVDRDAGPLLASANEALRLARRSESPELLARALLQLGPLAAGDGHNPEAAVALFKEAEANCLQRGDMPGALAALPGLTFCLIGQGRHLDAIELAQRGLEQAQGLRHVELQMLLFNRLGHAAEELRRYKQALLIYERQAVLASAHGMVYHLAYGIWNQCMPLVRLRRFEQAGLLMAFSKRYWLEHFGPIKPEDKAVLAEVRQAVIDRTSRTEWQRCWAKGWALSLPQALALAARARS